MILVGLNGGLGNQMFQYAAGRSLAAQRNDALKLDISAFEKKTTDTPRKYALGVFNIIENFASPEEIARFRASSALVEKIPFLRKNGYIKERQFHFDETIFDVPPGDMYLDGYWQSEKYFKGSEDIIRKEFTPKGGLGKEAKEAEEYISEAGENAVALHVRRSDYITNAAAYKCHGVCSLEYYQEAIEYIAKNLQHPHFFIFSDDVSWVKENIKIRFGTSFVSNGSLKDFEELVLMGRCSHAIIANSSFSWWGAWLIQNSKKIVVAPKMWFREDSYNTKDLIPESWTKL
jgi:hypothetical protein